ncbi:MAG: DUF1772 domain-containing protein [Acidobacteria bacterium]|nr:DUF1772 domain-containing protein [Acidobacteriota bacterium]
MARIQRMGALYFIALIAVSLYLAPSVAHVLEMPNKVGLDRAQYFTVQQIYSGWAMLGIVLNTALIATLALGIWLRKRLRRPAAWAFASFGCLVAGQVIFWVFTFPANRATSNWTQVPANWEALRMQWEYSHASGALLNLAAMATLVLSTLSWSRSLADRDESRGEASDC